MSVSYIPEKVKIRLWGKSAGRCQYDGCNKPLWLDSLTKAEFNTAYIAHIIADKPDGPRGDSILSEQLKSEISNLMLLCDEHHRLVDREDVAGHPVDRLRSMKNKHEARIELLGSFHENKQSHVLLYGANVGQHSSPVNFDRSVPAMLPNWYPAEKPGLELGLKNSSFQDHENDYWYIEREHLQRQFTDRIKPLLSTGAVKHFSIFALAPQPLLIELGRLLSDITAAEIYQLHREPPSWVWQHEDGTGFEYHIEEPEGCSKVVAINLSLSATIAPARITTVLGEDVSIWTMTINGTHNDFLKSRSQLSEFRKCFRSLLNLVKAKHGQDASLHVFPAVPVSIAVEIGRVWMPKADLPFMIYDQNTKTGGFTEVFQISPKT